MHELAGIQAFFNTEHGSVGYTAAQTKINQGIEEGQMVIAATVTPWTPPRRPAGR